MRGEVVCGVEWDGMGWIDVLSMGFVWLGLWDVVGNEGGPYAFCVCIVIGR